MSRSNNPFAPSPSLSTTSLPSFSQHLSASPGPQTAPVFNLQGTYASANSSPSPYANANNASPAPSSSPPAQASPSRQGTLQVKTRADEQHAHLANLFANRDDGVDTFGNFGQLRYASRYGCLRLDLTHCTGTGNMPIAWLASLRDSPSQVTIRSPSSSLSKVQSNRSSPYDIGCLLFICQAPCSSLLA